MGTVPFQSLLCSMLQHCERYGEELALEGTTEWVHLGDWIFLEGRRLCCYPTSYRSQSATHQELLAPP